MSLAKLTTEQTSTQTENSRSSRLDKDPRVCKFAPKKPSGPLSRRCIHCGSHKDEHGASAQIVEQENDAGRYTDANATPHLYNLSSGPYRVVSDDLTGTQVQVFDEDCYLLRNLLGTEEQTTLFQYIQDLDKTPLGDLKRCMFPTPKTLVLGNNEPTIRFKQGETSVVIDMVEMATDILKRTVTEKSGIGNLCKYSSLSVAVIQYESPHGHFPPHIDHCNDSYVYLMSLGCTANFMIKGPTMENKENFKFHSGDLLIFNSSTEAAILHGVSSIDDKESCHNALRDKFPLLQNNRYGVQCRLYY